ncbi:potassium channel subfamily K member 16-like [Dreissena polymorpha]|uniref:potassium channel subfamily K member 16-like n=1 Tax=Dreissena polymorpha TaxID=45954 RepID=UPI0022643970|nr:potassium channel subfamily K member 16-like [Dreissena polymorpha]
MGSEEVKKARNSGKRMCKKVLKIAFSHLGLCFLVVLYCLLGAALFELLERENEISICIDGRKEYDDMENKTLFSILDVILNNPVNSLAGDAQLIGVFEAFRNNSLAIGYDGSWCEGFDKVDGPMHEWTFAGSLFFAMTIVTTIGYGHIAPKTAWGRIMSISYAMIGIPLMLLFLTNIGGRACGHIPRDDEETNRRKPLMQIASKNEDGNDGVPGGIKALNGASIAQRGVKLRVSPTQSNEPLIIDEDNDEEDEEERRWDEISKVSIPLTVSLAIIGLYMVFGALLFKYWEGWDMLQSAYFCFITLSTIGFGDVTPSRDFSDPLTNFRLVVCYMYTTFGMAIMSMCFTLMQEEITEKFKWIGRKMGVVDEDEPEMEREENAHGNHSEC